MDSPYRKEQPLPFLKQLTYPKRWLFFDTETHMLEPTYEGVPQKLKLGVAIYVEFNMNLTIKKRVTHIFHSQEEFYSIIKSYDKTKKKLNVVAHNIKFDLEVTNLPFLLSQDDILTDPPIINGMVFLWSVKLDRGTISFMDSANFVPMSLAIIGKDLGFDKLDIDLHNANYQELVEYCIRDVEIVEKFITELLLFLYNNKLSGFRSTTASLSLAIFRTSFMKTQPQIVNYPPTLFLERKGYYGGRTEAWFIGQHTKENMYYVDITSSYPFSMLSDNIPIKFIRYREEPSIHMIDYHKNDRYIIADVTIKTSIPAYPLRFTKDLADKNRKYHLKKHDLFRQLNGKLIFPIGIFRTVLHHDELLHLLQNGELIELHSYSIYEKGSLFTDYINYFADLKNTASINGNRTQRLLAKLFLNSLYGKFGQLYHITEFSHEIETTINNSIPVIDTDDHIKEVEITWFGNVYRDITSGESTYSIPSIAGAITAKSRMLLWKYIEIAGFYNVYYMDTDSLIVNTAGFTALSDYIQDNVLGMLKLEQTSTLLEIYNNKDYRLGGMSKTKGVPLSAEQTNYGEWEYLRFEGFRQWMKRGANSEPLIFKQAKIRKTSYNKGIVTPYGDVIPYEFNYDYVTNLI